MPPIQELQPENPTPDIGAMYAGHALLSLVFMAGAFTAYAYFSGTAIASSDSQTAVAAAIAHEQEEAARPAFAEVSLEAESAIVYDVSTGAVLFRRNVESQLPLASLTKVPLVLAVSEALPLSSVMTLSSGASGAGSTDSLSAGTSWTTQDLIAYTLTSSSNDGAQALADAADEPLRTRYPQAPMGTAAVWLMNRLAHELGLAHTYFLNPTGLDESTTQSGAYGSAADVAKLFAFAASTSADLFRATASERITITSPDGRTATAANTDEALGDIPGLVMGKTGFTDLAGGNLAVVADLVPGHRIVAVVLGSSRDGRFSDMRTLIAAAQDALSPVPTTPQH